MSSLGDIYEKHGNPNNLEYYQNQSCWRKGTLASSGTPAPGLAEKLGNDTKYKDGERMKEVKAMDETIDTDVTLWIYELVRI